MDIYRCLNSALNIRDTSVLCLWKLCKFQYYRATANEIRSIARYGGEKSLPFGYINFSFREQIVKVHHVKIYYLHST